MRVGIVAGEPSGDFLGAGLIKAFQAIYPDAEFFGICGPKMMLEGGRSLWPMEDISIMGFEGLAANLRRILKIRKSLKAHFLSNPPDVFVGIDVPDFNLGLEKTLRRHGIPTVHYVSPTVWAWRRYRIHKIRKAVSHMLTLFPFEADFYQRQEIPATFVGHPIANEISANLDQATARSKLNLSPSARIVALLPGSRSSEIQRLTPVFIQTATLLQTKQPDLIFITPMVDDRMKTEFQRIQQASANESDIRLFDGQSRLVMAAADVVLAASGTAALEAALLEKPLVVAYKVSTPTALFVKLFCHVNYYAMPNHLLDKPSVPEYVQQEANAENLSSAVENYLNNPQQAYEMKKKFSFIRKQLEGDASSKAARIIARQCELGV